VGKKELIIINQRSVVEETSWRYKYNTMDNLKKAGREYLSLSKQRKPGYQKIREGIKLQLGYVKRNLPY
jgi:hypothetical protein